MSGIEVVALVAGIVSAFSGTASYLKERKKRKAEKAEAKSKEMERLQVAIKAAPPQIQLEYDTDFARIGAKFASGDSIARTQLTGILINMQQHMIQTLQEMLVSEPNATSIDYSAMLNISDSSREDSISALAQQYQRLSVAAPITSGTLPIVPTEPAPTFCPGAIHLQNDDSIGQLVSGRSWTCSWCKIELAPIVFRSFNPPPWQKGCEGMHRAFRYKQHVVRNGKIRYQCLVCWERRGIVSKVMNVEAWLKHMQEHFSNEGLRMCKGSDGKQQMKSKCKDSVCTKLHAGVQ